MVAKIRNISSVSICFRNGFVCSSFRIVDLLLLIKIPDHGFI